MLRRRCAARQRRARSSSCPATTTPTLVRPWVRAHGARGARSTPAIPLDATPLLARVAAWLAPRRVRVRYPGVWLGGAACGRRTATTWTATCSRRPPTASRAGRWAACPATARRAGRLRARRRAVAHAAGGVRSPAGSPARWPRWSMTSIELPARRHDAGIRPPPVSAGAWPRLTARLLGVQDAPRERAGARARRPPPRGRRRLGRVRPRPPRRAARRRRPAPVEWPRRAPADRQQRLVGATSRCSSTTPTPPHPVLARRRRGASRTGRPAGGRTARPSRRVAAALTYAPSPGRNSLVSAREASAGRLRSRLRSIQSP